MDWLVWISCTLADHVVSVPPALVFGFATSNSCWSIFVARSQEAVVAIAFRFQKPAGFKRLANVIDPTGFVFRNKEVQLKATTGCRGERVNVCVSLCICILIYQILKLASGFPTKMPWKAVVRMGFSTALLPGHLFHVCHPGRSTSQCFHWIHTRWFHQRL